MLIVETKKMYGEEKYAQKTILYVEDVTWAEDAQHAHYVGHLLDKTLFQFASSDDKRPYTEIQLQRKKL